ncbi:hypothetical protein VB005_02305 [Metarhizium brunneum]
MIYLTALAVLSTLAAANPLIHRQDQQQADDALTLRANLCLHLDKPECKGVLEKCKAEEKYVEDCIPQEHPTCMQDESSPCSKAVVQCLADHSEEEEAFKDCILETVMPAPDTVDDADNEQSAPSGSGQAELACESVTVDFEDAWVSNECGGTTDASLSNDVALENEPAACKEARDAFDEVWDANNCEAVLNAALGTSQGDLDPDAVFSLDGSE